MSVSEDRYKCLRAYRDTFPRNLMHGNARTHARAPTHTHAHAHAHAHADITHAHGPSLSRIARPPRRDRCADPSVCVCLFVDLVCLFAPHVRVGQRRRAQRCPRRRRFSMRTRMIMYKCTPLRAALRRPAAHAAVRSAADGVDRSHCIQFAVIRRDACLPRYSRRAVRVCSAAVYL